MQKLTLTQAFDDFQRSKPLLLALLMTLSFSGTVYILIKFKLWLMGSVHGLTPFVLTAVPIVATVLIFVILVIAPLWIASLIWRAHIKKDLPAD